MKLFSHYVTLRLAIERHARSLAQGSQPLAASRAIALKVCADAGGKAVMLIITIAAARRLNADPFGVMAFGMATGWLLGVASDAGLSMHLAKQTARSEGLSRRALAEIVGLRAGLAFFAATVMVLATPRVVPAHWRMQFVLLILAQLCAAITETVAHYFRGLQRSEIESAIHASSRAAMLVAALAVLWWWRRLDYLAVAMLVPASIAMVVSIGIAVSLSVRRKPDTIRPEATWSPPSGGLTAQSFMRDVLPLGAATLLSALYFRIDVFFIEYWHGLQPVGGYNAVFRLVEALRLLPAAVMAVTFPLLVRAVDTRAVRALAGRLTAAGAVMAAMCALGSTLIVPLVYGASYAYAAPAFAVLSLALPLFFLNYALTHQVIGWDGQRAYLAIATLALLANVIANIILIPSQGIVGAALATIITELVVTAGCVAFLNLVLNPRVEPSCGTSAMNPRVEPPCGTSVMNPRVEPPCGTSVMNPRVEPPGRTIVTPARSQELAFLKAVIYASLFDYPLTLAQVHATLVDVRADEQAVASWWRTSAFLQAVVEHRDGWYFPAGRADLLATRARREALSRELLARDGRILSLISRLPFVRMVALSGSLAHLNAEGSADLDLFVITAPGRVWSVTLATLVLTRLLGCRKHVCMNYVVSEREMAIAPQDLFSANQIIHLRPICGDDVFARFLAANAFVKRIYPNFATEVRGGFNEDAYPKSQVPSPKPRLTERLARLIYRRHLSARAAGWLSRDQVRLDDECLKLHTTSHRASTMAAFDAAMARVLHNTKDTKNTKTFLEMPMLLSGTGL